jgi:hypothetical protein
MRDVVPGNLTLLDSDVHNFVSPSAIAYRVDVRQIGLHEMIGNDSLAIGCNSDFVEPERIRIRNPAKRVKDFFRTHP